MIAGAAAVRLAACSLALGVSLMQLKSPLLAPSPVARVADLVEANYFDETKAKAIARELRNSLARGEFDHQRDRRDIAGALSAALQRHDAHFSVAWIGPPLSGETGPPEPVRMDEDVRLRRVNFGFRRVEILPGNIGLLELSEFADADLASDWNHEARRAADAALAFLERTDALVVDLRDNGGGGAMATYLLSHFLPLDTAFSEMRGRLRVQVERTLTRIGGQHRPVVPLFVLVSARTGSAAEFFAYSLQAVRRATIVGERTHGAANPGMTFEAGEGFEVFIPLDTPINRTTGTNWEGIGVLPDVTVDAGAALARAQALALRHVVRSERDPAAARDARWALDALEAPRPARAMDLRRFAGTFGSRIVRVESGVLVLRRGRWPARTLWRLDDDLFFVEGAPWRRVRFDRDARGRIVALEELTSDGDVTRWRRTGDVEKSKRE